MARTSPVGKAFFREAMATTFSIRVAHQEPRYGRQAATAALGELDRLEAQLSRFVEGSDVWQINRLTRGEAAVVTLDTYRCLAIAEELRASTGGAFDVTYASDRIGEPSELIGLIPAGCIVRMQADGVRVDLGGIGKGYALDVMAAVLREWDVTAACLAASDSTILALAPPPNGPGWIVTLGDEPHECRLVVSHTALSGSGIGVKGYHVVDPRTHEAARRHVRAWSRAATAAQADALSTAFLVMTHEEVQTYCKAHGGVTGYLLDGAGEPLHVFPQ